MQINYFVGQSVEWLEEQLKQCQADLAAGKTLMQWGAGDSSGMRKIQLTPQQRWEMIYFALTALDPDKYPATNARVRRATARYTFD